jgi:hypothetical protein
MLLDLLVALGAALLTFVVICLLAGWALLRRLSSAGTFATSAPPTALTTAETVICGAALGVFAGFVHSFGLGAPWPALLQFAIAVAATYGVNVITGAAFRNLFNLSSGVLMLISLVLGAVEIGAPYMGIGSTAAGIVSGAVAFLLSLGFGTAVSQAAAKRAAAR